MKSATAATAAVAGMVVGAAPRAHGRTGGKTDPNTSPLVNPEALPALSFFKSETFAPYVGGVFTARASAREIEMTLKVVRDFTPSAKSMRVTKRALTSESFALVFSSKSPLSDPTGIYQLEHGALGTFPLFMTRRDLPDGTHAYEAVFNHAR